MQLVIFNTTGSTITYLSGAVSITAGGNTAITKVSQQVSLATDGALRADILANNVYITDGTNNFGSSDAIAYLYELIDAVGSASDVITVGGQNRAQSVTSTAAEAMGAVTRLTNRKYISLTPTNGTIYWGYAIGVTVATGEPIFKNTTKVLAFTDAVPVYVVSAGTIDTRITEGA